MKQYNAIKAKYPDALLLFRVGDFYETFGEDAVRAARVLGITLTERAIASTDRPLIRHWLARTRDELDRTGLPDAARRILRDDIDEPDRLQSTWGRGQRHPSDLSRAMAAAAWRGKRRCAQWLEARGAHMPWLGPALFCADIAWLERLHRDGARVEPPLGGGLGCLHLLALLPSEVDVEPLARRLLEWGAELDAAPRRWGSAVSFAKRLGRSDVVDALRRSSSRAAFRWQAEARASGIERVVFFYDKADGLVFTPQRAELPFEVGGDYDGGYPSSAVRALEQVRGTRLWKRLTASQQRVIESLAVGEDLSLESILAVVPERSVRRRD